MIIPNILDRIASISMYNPPTIITQPGISSHCSLVVRRNSKPLRCSMIRQCSKLYWPLADAECCLDVPSWYLVLDHAYNLVICTVLCIHALYIMIHIHTYVQWDMPIIYGWVINVRVSKTPLLPFCWGISWSTMKCCSFPIIFKETPSFTTN